MPSSVPPTKQAILALLQAHTWPVFTPDIRWGGPTNLDDYSQGGEMIYFAEIVDYDDDPRDLGAQTNQESYGVVMYIDVVQYGDDEQATDVRAWQLHSELRGLLHANHNLISDPGEMTVMLGSRSARQANVPLPEQWLSRIVVTQDVTAVVFNQ